MRLITILGLVLIFTAFLGLIKVVNEPLAIIYTDEGPVYLMPRQPIYSLIGFTSEGVKLRLPNGSVIDVVGVGEVPIRVGDTEITLLFDARGRFLALTTANFTISNVEISEEFSKAVLTYTVAPFVSGLAFTTASLLVSRRSRRR